tara:strand:- start:560 stop:1060 length:501 start_codon:yes stop_codon:yes gene_type:complete
MNLIEKINKMTKSEFVSVFGNIFEKTIWIAEKTYALKPFKNYEELSSKILEVYENSKKEKHLEIFNSHPSLVVEKILTEDSKKEQNSSELDQCSKEEFEEFKKLNIEYKKKFLFPFIIAVRGKNRNEILNNFRQRITNNINLEFIETKKQVKKIANFRLDEIIKKN